MKLGTRWKANRRLLWANYDSLVSSFKKLEGAKDIWEVRVKADKNIYRIFCFFAKNKFVILTHGIKKKSQKTPLKEIQKAEEYKKEYFQVSVVTWDERYTSLIAESAMLSDDVSRKGRRAVIDKLAAQIILQSYLDSLHSS